MAVTETIQELLQGIDDAQYGRDMRQYIHKGIQKCYEEGSAGETDLTARTEIDNVRDEMQDLLGNFATVEPLSTATKAYKVGDKLVYNNTMYRVTSAIAVGGLIRPGTNVIATTVETEQQKIGDCKRYEVYNREISAPVSNVVLLESDTIPAGTHLVFAHVEFASTQTTANLSMDVGKGESSISAMLSISERGNGASKTFTSSGCIILTAPDKIQIRVSNSGTQTNYTGLLHIVTLSNSTGS